MKSQKERDIDYLMAIQEIEFQKSQYECDQSRKAEEIHLKSLMEYPILLFP